MKLTGIYALLHRKKEHRNSNSQLQLRRARRSRCTEAVIIGLWAEQGAAQRRGQSRAENGEKERGFFTKWMHGFLSVLCF